MQEQLISFETARLAKEKGFDLIPYLTIDNENPKNLNSNYNPREYQPWYFQITQSLLQKHLREVNKIIVQVECNYYDDELGWNTYSVTIFHRTHNKTTECFYRTYEEALEVGLVEALKLI